MTNGGDHSWDFLSAAEADSTQAAMTALREQEWARPLITAVTNNGGMTRANKSLMFETRFAYALHRAGIGRPQYEVGGEGASTIDFGFASEGQEWLVELMRLEETRAARAATRQETGGNGITWISRVLSSGSGDSRQSESGETLKAVERICQKCEREGAPYKFPVPNGRYHALLVDFRTFLNGGDVQDRIHVGLGGQFVASHWYQRFWDRRLISGVFSRETTLRGAAECQARVHFIGFVNERTYQEDTFGPAIQFIANPFLFEDAAAMRAAIATWPLQPADVINDK